MDFEPLTIRVVDVSQLTGFPDYKIRKLIKTRELKAVKVGRSVLIDYDHFKAFCIRHRQHEIRSQKVVSLHWPIVRRRVP